MIKDKLEEAIKETNNKLNKWYNQGVRDFSHETVRCLFLNNIHKCIRSRYRDYKSREYYYILKRAKFVIDYTDTYPYFIKRIAALSYGDYLDLTEVNEALNSIDYNLLKVTPENPIDINFDNLINIRF